MRERYFNCYTLGRSAPAQDRLDFVLPCHREQALQLFALLIDKKAILVPYGHTVAFRVPNTMLSVCRVSSYTMATFLWRCGYLVGSTNPVTRFMDKVGRHIQLFRHLHRDEQSIDEVVLELFYSTQGQTPCIDLPDPEVYPEDLLLARLHFAEISPAQTILRLFLGWTDSASLEALSQLYDVLDRYMDLLHRVLQPNDPPVAPVKGETPVTAKPEGEAQQERPFPEIVTAAECVTMHCAAEDGGLEAATQLPVIEDTWEEIVAVETATQSPPPTAEASEDQPLAEWQVQATEGKDRLHQENSFGPIDEPEVAAGESLSEAVADPEDPVGQQLLAAPVPTEDELQLYRKMKSPRMYASTLCNICVMVTERQRQIDAEGEIPKLDTFNSRVRPSRNTMLKIPELFTHWFDRRYRWNIITWLRHHSGHTETEISEILSTLYHSLSPEAWAAVTSAGKEAESNRSRHHRAREEGKPRPGEQFGTVN
ncbi:MAG: hypothetical protein IPM53_19970 [Anaerolineaceae bacterium]|nr:hypothetical protein [Anaerolineaceae bacterium]